MPRVISVGRLDLNSEGLLLLTNDGELARRLELPATGWVRRYRVRVHGEVDQTQLAQLAKGITVEGVRYGGIEATFDRKQGDNVWLTMALTEGKNREIRNICGHFGWPVSRLIRVAYGPFQLGSHLNPGDIEEVPAKVLREQVGASKVHKVSGQLKLKQTSHGERPREKPRTEKPRAGKPHRRQAGAASGGTNRNVMRIEAGAHKGTKLTVPDGTDVRPTSDRARQAIFNMLIHRFDAVEGASVLDAFAGSGALGLEALSRGAASLVAMELARPALDTLKHNISACRENARTLVFACNALSPPPAQPRYAPCSLVFLDPPYGQGLIAPALAALDKAGWVAPGALIVAEMGVRDPVPEGKTLAVEDERRYGKARIVFLRTAQRRDREAI